MNKSKTGFTLIELLVVIVVIGLLASAVTIGILSVQTKARDSRRREDLDMMSKLVQSYYADHFVYPSTGDEWWGDCADDYRQRVISGTGAQANPYPIGRYYIPEIYPDYAQQLAVDPRWTPSTTDTRCYNYRSNETDFKIRARGTVEYDYDRSGAAFVLKNDSMRDPQHSDEQYFAVFSTGGDFGD